MAGMTLEYIGLVKSCLFGIDFELISYPAFFYDSLGTPYQSCANNIVQFKLSGYIYWYCVVIDHNDMKLKKKVLLHKWFPNSSPTINYMYIYNICFISGDNKYE